MTVPLGEIRSDDAGHLLVLGGHGTSASPAGNAIGELLAERRLVRRRLRRPGDRDDHAPRGQLDAARVEGAWVIVAPPKFAPHQDSVDDAVRPGPAARWSTSGLAAAPTATLVHATTSIRSCSGPATSRWVEGHLRRPHLGRPGHQPAQRDAIFTPAPAGGGEHARAQRRRLGAHADPATRTCSAGRTDNFTQDWAGVPQPRGDRDARRPGPRGARGLRRRRLLPGHRGRRPRPPAIARSSKFAVRRRVPPRATLRSRAGDDQPVRWRCPGRPTSRPAATTGGRCRGRTTSSPQDAGSQAVGPRRRAACDDMVDLVAHPRLRRAAGRRARRGRALRRGVDHPAHAAPRLQSTCRRARWAWCARQPSPSSSR